MRDKNYITKVNESKESKTEKQTNEVKLDEAKIVEICTKIVNEALGSTYIPTGTYAQGHGLVVDKDREKEIGEKVSSLIHSTPKSTDEKSYYMTIIQKLLPELSIDTLKVACHTIIDLSFMK